VTWVVPGEGIALLDHPALTDGEFASVVAEARHLGEITLVTLAVDAVPGCELRLTLAGPRRLRVAVGERIGVRLDPSMVHVMPVRDR